MKIIPEFGDLLIAELVRVTEDPPAPLTTVPKNDGDFTFLIPALQEVYFQVETIMKKDRIRVHRFTAQKLLWHYNSSGIYPIMCSLLLYLPQASVVTIIA